MKKVLQVLLDESELADIDRVKDEEGLPSRSSAGRKVILAGLKALDRE